MNFANKVASKAAFVAVLGILVAGCNSNPHAVIATTATTIGVEVGQEQATGTPKAVLGYKRAEFAFVPTNRGSLRDRDGCNSALCGAGAKDSADVVMELSYGALFSVEKGSIYQRLAVGSEAVKHGAAAVLFAKDAEGKVSAGAAQIGEAAVKAAAAEATLSKKIAACVSKDGVPVPAKIDELVTASGIDTAKRASSITRMKSAKSADQLASILDLQVFNLLPQLDAGLPKITCAA